MNIGIGIGIDKQGPISSGYTPSAEAAAWKAAIVAEGGTVSDAVLEAFDSNVFIPAYSGGGNSTLTVAHCVHIWLSNSNNIASRMSVEGNEVFASNVSTPTFDNNGIKSSGTSYVNLNFNPNGIVAKDNVFVGVIVQAPLFNATVRTMGCTSNTSGRRLEVYELSSSAFGFSNSDNFTSNTNTATTGSVFIYSKRSNATQQVTGINTNEVTGSVNSTDVPNNNMYLLTSNIDGTPSSDYCTETYVEASVVAQASFDAVAFKTMITNLKAALAAL